MGTLFNQEPRNYYHVEYNDVIKEIETIKRIALENDITFEQVLDIKKMLENKRRNNLYAYNGDTFDEQMKGLGDLFQEFNGTFNELNQTFMGGFYDIKDKISLIGEMLYLKNDGK